MPLLVTGWALIQLSPGLSLPRANNIAQVFTAPAPARGRLLNGLTPVVHGHFLALEFRLVALAACRGRAQSVRRLDRIGAILSEGPLVSLG